MNRPARNTAAEPSRPRLTRRELECLQLLLDGEQLKRIGFILGVTRKTAEHYVAAARQKLGAKTTAQAVGIAVEQGIIGTAIESTRDLAVHQ